MSKLWNRPVWLFLYIKTDLPSKKKKKEMNLSLGHAHTPAFHRSCIFLGWWKQTSQKEQSRAGDVLYLKVHQREYEPSVTSQKCGNHFLEHRREQWELDLARCFEWARLITAKQLSCHLQILCSLPNDQLGKAAMQSANNTMSKCGVKFRWILRCGCRKREATRLQGGTHSEIPEFPCTVLPVCHSIDLEHTPGFLF